MRLKFKPWQLVSLKDVKCRSLWFAIVNHNFPSQDRNTQKPCFYPTDVQAECVCGVLLSGVLLLTVKWAGKLSDALQLCSSKHHRRLIRPTVHEALWNTSSIYIKKTDQSDIKWQLSVGLTQSSSVKKRGNKQGETQSCSWLAGRCDTLHWGGTNIGSKPLNWCPHLSFRDFNDSVE